MKSDITAVAPLSAGLLKAHLMIAATHMDPRFYLNGILLDAPRSRLVSTDGHVLLVSGLALGTKARKLKPAIIPREPLEKLIKRLPKTAAGLEQTIEVSVGAGQANTPRYISLRTKDDELATHEVDGTYPDYERVVPKDCSGELSQFDPVFLYRLHRALNLAQKKSSPILPIYVRHNGERPALVSCEEPLLLGVVMPWRAEKDTTELSLNLLGLKTTPAQAGPRRPARAASGGAKNTARSSAHSRRVRAALDFQSTR